MKFTCILEIDQPLEKVVGLFMDNDNLGKWQTGFVSHTPTSGKPGEVGAKADIVIQNGKHVINLVETVIENKLPAEMIVLYEHEHMVNTVKHNFTALTPHKTRWELETHYTKFIGFIPNLMAILVPGMFKKQTQKWIEQFKIFAEGV